mgnify:CR=1 FL=1
MKFAVIRTGGKQYIVAEGDNITIDNLNLPVEADVTFEKLAEGDSEKGDIKLGKPVLPDSVKGKIIEVGKGEKIRVARFKAKTRYRKVTGFRPMLTKVTITSL